MIAGAGAGSSPLLGTPPSHPAPAGAPTFPGPAHPGPVCQTGPAEQVLRNQPVNLQLLQIWSKPETFSDINITTANTARQAEVLKGMLFYLGENQDIYTPATTTTTINIILECFARHEKYEVIMCAELSREERRGKQDQNTQF